jgi:hypothetical protein
MNGLAANRASHAWHAVQWAAGHHALPGQNCCGCVIPGRSLLLLLLLVLLQILFWKKRAEEELQRSGLSYTIVRPGGRPEPTLCSTGYSWHQTAHVVLWHLLFSLVGYKCCTGGHTLCLVPDGQRKAGGTRGVQ